MMIGLPLGRATIRQLIGLLGDSLVMGKFLKKRSSCSHYAIRLANDMPGLPRPSASGVTPTITNPIFCQNS